MNERDFRILHPNELFKLTEKIISIQDLTEKQKNDYLELAWVIADLRSKWEKAWTTFGEDPSGEMIFRDLIIRFLDKSAMFIAKGIIEDAGKKAIETIRTSMFLFKERYLSRLNRINELQQERYGQDFKQSFRLPVFEKPIFILSAPRAGSTLLFETLSVFPDIWTIGRESHETMEGIKALHPASFDYASNRLVEENAEPHIVCELMERFTWQLKDSEGRLFLKLSSKKRPRKVRFLEKTPKNALRVPFLNTVFPGARFIFLYRDARENISSLMEGWRSRRYVAYLNIPGWPFKEWSFLLVPGWRNLTSASISEIATFQWITANNYIMTDLKALPRNAWLSISFQDLVKNPLNTVKKIADFANLKWDKRVVKKVSKPLPESCLTLTPPAPDKWKKNYRDIMSILPKIKPIMNKLESMNG